MKTKVGLWIDHRKAIIATGADEAEEIRLTISKTEKQPRGSRYSPLKDPHESQQVPADDSRQRAFTGDLNIYYGAVIAAIGDGGIDSDIWSW
ncbi:MAG: hypothetical protein V1792_10080 [Pseudomonadota bacterium]